MKNLTLFLVLMIFFLLQSELPAQSVPHSPQGWGIVASYTIPGKASGLAWDGTYIYFGIYGLNGNKIYKFNPTSGTNTLQCTGTFEDAYGLTYKSPSLVTIDQAASSSNPSSLLEFNMSGTTVSTLTLPDHYMSGCAWDNNSWWVCTYYPDPGIIYNISTSGTILSQFVPPSNQPWDICKQGSDLWIADYYANTLYKVTTTGTVLESHASANVNPSGVVFDGTYLWYCDGPLGSNSTLYKVDLSASGTPVIFLPTTTHNYGAVTIGSFSTWNCQVHNSGTANLVVNGVSIPSGQPISTSMSFPQTVTPGNSINIPLKYTPVESVILNTQVAILSSDPVNPSENVTLKGVGVYPGAHIMLDDTSHDWQVRRVGAYSRWYLSVTNNGNSDLVINDLTTSDSRFIVDDSITFPVTIPSLNTSDFGIWFHPAEGQAYYGSLSISSNAAGGPTTIGLHGSGEETDYPIGTELWRYRINDAFDNSPKSIGSMDDITGDGVKEVVVGSEDNFIRCFNGNASVDGDVLWATEIYSGAVYNQNSIVTINDINLDGYRDIIVGTAWGDCSIIALSGKTGMQLWKHDTHEYGDGGWVYQVDTRFDYNSDGFPDVLAATGDDGNGTGPMRVYCLDGHNGNTIWARYIGGPVFSVIGVEDITGDGKPDVISGASNSQETVGKVQALDGTNGVIKWTYSTPGSSVWALMQLDDINGDGKRDIAAGDFNGTIVFLNATNGSKIHELGVGSVIILRFVDMGDINKNGYRDILVAHSGTNAYIVDGYTCTKIWNTPLADKSWCVARIQDVSWDGYDDVIIGTLYQNNMSYYLDGTNGNVFTSLPFQNPVDALNSIPDIVGDSTWEMVVGDREGLLACYSGGYDTTSFPVGMREPGKDEISFRIYPNPTDGKFRLEIVTPYETPADARIVDIEGKEVVRFALGTLKSGRNEEYLQFPANVKSGVYILELTSPKISLKGKLLLKM